MKTPTVRLPLVTKRISVLEVQQFQVKQQFTNTAVFMSTFRNCQTYNKLILTVLFVWKDLITGTAVLFSDELQPLCEGLDDVQPLFHGLGELDSDELLNAEECLPNQGKISPKVAIPGRNEEVYKAMLVFLLNEGPQLSHDRYYFKNYSRHWATRLCYKTIVS